MTSIAIPSGMPQYDDVPRFDVARVRADFPILDREINGHPLVYLDSANTSHKPRQVLDVLDEHYARHNANVSRSVHTLGTEATEAYEGARAKVAAFISAPSVDEVVFTKNSTEAINIVAYAFSNASLRPDADSRFRLGPGDEVVISEMEHHSNIVPWQLLCERTGATLRWFPVTDQGRLDESGLEDLVTERTKIVSLVHMSNILGTVNATSRITARVREVGALLLLDCSQSVPHLPIDVVDLDADFIVFTGHKMCGPTGIGVLWGRGELLAAMPPVFGGGSMIETVTMARSTFAAPPARFEAGTPPIAEAVALGAAVDYLTGIGMPAIQWHEKELTAYALDALGSVPDLRIFGPTVPVGRGGTISFALGDVHPHDVGQVLDSLGVQVRVGHHCAKPVCSRFGVPAMTRASFYLYTTTEEIDALVAGLEQVRKVFD
ncbi:cysteine desulfurase [Micromonospora ureilytica]|uniref:cysteine desulfurase n=1 Tax=Micromonospora ureilytica TaxID=709868 RepID=A0A3N9XNF5_9ACTN|nr:cysteine desulfurase [Micromonospora ureilytica]MBG6064253.1 cysteine desulfurase/selenocysteine lyase [Micromonospora ureilytica]RQX14302.1 cysteine desulfurase [Micromonospora ureilytica]WSR56082.1 cysteine desulfurase [Micromonospora ureilytica]